MALRRAGETDFGEKVESIVYTPTLQDSSDLEAATKTITATAEASGTGNADYSKSLTLAKPSDARLLVKRIASRLAVTIDSMTAGHLYCRVYVDSQDAAHRLFDEDWTATGEKLDAADFASGGVFDAIADGAAHTFYFFFWVDAGNAVISVVQIQLAIGTKDTTPQEILRLDFGGLVSVVATARVSGTGTPQVVFGSPSDAYGGIGLVSGHAQRMRVPAGVVLNYAFLAKGTVNTDLNYCDAYYIVLRSEQ